MAAMIRLMSKVDDIVSEICHRMQNAEENREVEFHAAVRIQAWYRGVRLRTYLKYLNVCATVAQKWWRGYKARKCFREVLVREVHLMKYGYYSAKAVKIQKIWRGYRSRKCIFDFYHRKRYFAELERKNAIVRDELAAFVCNRELDKKLNQQDTHGIQMMEFACNHHYLVSTLVQPGVFNSPYQAEKSEVEFYLRNVKPVVERRKTISVPTCDGQLHELFDPSCSVPDHKCCAELPPPPQKPQGPFRHLDQIQKRRYRPLCPTLRVQTSYYSVRDARIQYKLDDLARRITDRDFVLSTKVTREPYDATLHSKSQYVTCHGFRDVRPECWISMNFHSVLPPIDNSCPDPD